MLFIFSINAIQISAFSLYEYNLFERQINRVEMGNFCTGEEQISQPSVAGSRIKNPSAVKNQPLSSYAYQVLRPNLNGNVQSTLNDPKLKSNKVVEVQDGPFFYIPSRKAFYQGSFGQNRLPEGFGIAIFQDGTYYQGQFKDGDAFDEQAIVIFPNGAFYKGSVKDSSLNGQGVLNHKNVYNYEGLWMNGAPEGNGSQKYNKQNTNYAGNFIKGQKNGVGTYTWDNGGSKYLGQFSKGLMHDKSGRIQAKGGLKYNGQFKLGKRQGQGAIQTNDGVLQGNFKNDEINGPGKFIWKDGKTYEGQFRKSQFDGKGRIIYPNGRVAEGVWQKNHNKYVSGIKA